MAELEDEVQLLKRELLQQRSVIVEREATTKEVRGSPRAARLTRRLG